MGEGAFWRVARLPSGQKQVDQRNQRSTHPGGDQDVIGSEVALWIEIDQGFIRFLGHVERVRPGTDSLCEADHTGRVFFAIGGRNGFRDRNWSSGAGTGSGKMSQQFQLSRFSSSWRGGRGERLWLSTLVDAMERVAEPARRAEPCDPRALKDLRAQLALPTQPRFTSSFGLRN